MEFKTAYGPKEPVRTVIEGKSMTKQSMQKETDITFILDQFARTGMQAHQAEHEGMYGDFANVDYHEALNIVRDAEATFETVPAKIRKRFDNDAGQFLAFCNDENNLEEMYELGLANRPPPAPEVPAEAPAEAPPE